MELYRVEAAFSTIDTFSRIESINMGPYMHMGQVIEAVNDTHSANNSALWINETEVVREEFYSSTDRHPTPDNNQKELFYESGAFVCGFTSLEKLRDWFCNRDLRILKTTHFMIVKYKFDGRFKRSIKSNEYQDVFDLRKCKPIGFIDIEDLLGA